MENIDYKLDLFNSVRNYQKNANENDNLIFIHHNPKNGEVFYSRIGDIHEVSLLFIIDNYISHPDKESEIEFKSLKEDVIELAFNIIGNDKDLINLIKEKLNQL